MGHPQQVRPSSGSSHLSLQTFLWKFLKLSMSNTLTFFRGGAQPSSWHKLMQAPRNEIFKKTCLDSSTRDWDSPHTPSMVDIVIEESRHSLLWLNCNMALAAPCQLNGFVPKGHLGYRLWLRVAIADTLLVIVQIYTEKGWKHEEVLQFSIGHCFAVFVSPWNFPTAHSPAMQHWRPVGSPRPQWGQPPATRTVKHG